MFGHSRQGDGTAELTKQRSKANIPQGYRYCISACKASKKYGLCVTFCIVFIDIASYQLSLITVIPKSKPQNATQVSHKPLIAFYL
jgi:hypothetical protein